MSAHLRSQLATARLEDAVAVSEAWQQARGRCRADYLRLFGSQCHPETLRAAEGRLAAADLQLAEARRLERIAWDCYE
jgi:hypothetical protein